MSSEDITNSIILTLPSHLRDIVVLVGRTFRRPVRFVLVDRCEGSARAEAHVEDGQPEIRVMPGWTETHIAHELMHLRRWAEGHPSLAPTQRGWDLNYERVLWGISSTVDEYTFFPQLVAWGYDPAADYGRWMMQKPAPPAKGTSIGHHRASCVLAVEYARAELIVKPSPHRDRFLVLFDIGNFHEVRGIGQRIVQVVKSNVDPTPAGTRKLLEIIVSSYLEIPNDFWEIRYALHC